jgi:hypothetical protein
MGVMDGAKSQRQAAGNHIRLEAGPSEVTQHFICWRRKSLFCHSKLPLTDRIRLLHNK